MVRVSVRAARQLAVTFVTIAAVWGTTSTAWGAPPTPASAVSVTLSSQFSAPRFPASAPIVTAIDGGSSHTCAIDDGAAKCWGSNDSGQLGDGTTDSSPEPVQVSGLDTGVTAIAAADDHTCAIQDGAAKCWGSNGQGQLGDGTTTASNVPVDVSGLDSGVTAIATGEYYACAIQDGAVKCWGGNSNGQLGNGTTENSLEPVEVTDLGSGVTAITAGAYFTCAIDVGGAAKCWGWNVFGQLGDGGSTDSSVPVQVSGLDSGVTAIAVGGLTTCAIQSGAAKCWGVNWQGQLGDGSNTSSSVPVQVSGLGSEMTAIATGGGHSCAVDATGAAKCWGVNSNDASGGMLGDGTTTDSNVPVPVSGLDSGVTAITAGANHSCAIHDDAAKCWGINQLAQLGDGTTEDRYSPVLVKFPDTTPPSTTTTVPLSVTEIPAPDGSTTDPVAVQPGGKFKVRGKCRNTETVTFTFQRQERTATCDGLATTERIRPSASGYTGTAEVEFTAPATPGTYEIVVELGTSLERYVLDVTVTGATDTAPTTTAALGTNLPATGRSNQASSIAITLLGLGILATWLGRRTAAR